jgi:DnaJ-class molecular chaperone
MNFYFLVCVLLVAAAGTGLWLMRPKKCKECGGSGKIVCHDGADFYHSACFKCKGTGWRS